MHHTTRADAVLLLAIGMVIQVLVYHDILPDSHQVHVVLETLVLLIGAIVGVWG